MSKSSKTGFDRSEYSTKSRKRRTAKGDDMLPEYDFSNAVRGKYYERYRQSTNVVLLDPDVAEVFPNAAAVNEALRLRVTLADAKASRDQTQTGRPTKALQPTSSRPISEKLARSKRLAAERQCVRPHSRQMAMRGNVRRRFYTEYAWAFDLIIDRPVRKESATIVSWLIERRVRPGADVLDAGCDVVLRCGLRKFR
jgi:hypothetical protein